MRPSSSTLALWIETALASGIRIRIQFAKTFTAYKGGILACKDVRSSSGARECADNDVRTRKRVMIVGVPDRKRFKHDIPSSALHRMFGADAPFCSTVCSCPSPLD